ncbi:MAG: hypothetical protein M1830_008396 [Pleopsidium flavum]|nr:MAG: hypothetical protein M1830_008396 [Pleopsidium flavum]
MPAADSPAVIVARFLNANHYNETLEAFLSEAALPSDAATIEKGDLTIENILEEKKTFDLSVRFERFGVRDEGKGWSVPAPTIPKVLPILPTSSNILHVSIEGIEANAVGGPFQCILAATADRRLHRLRAAPPFAMLGSDSQIHDSPILSCLVLGAKYLITTSMSGQVLLFDLEKESVIEERRDHKKYVVKVKISEDEEGAWVATAGWDAKVYIYRLQFAPHDQSPSIGPPIACLALPTNPEDVLFVPHPDSVEPVLIVSRRDSTSLHYYSLPSRPSIESLSTVPQHLRFLGKQSLAPHSNAWIAFSPSSLASCPTDSTLLAVATSAVPHMKLIIVRLLLPPLTEASGGTSEPITQIQQTRANLAIQEREDAAILTHTSTLAPQTPYSTPQACWRPDGTGIWVNGDDGALRGVEAKTGKIVVTLRGGHEVGSKVRTIWAGWVHVGGRKEEWVMSGGFDRRLVVWQVDDTSGDGT